METTSIVQGDHIQAHPLEGRQTKARSGLGRLDVLRAAGDVAGVARFVMNGGFTRAQRRATAFTQAEAAEMARIEEDRDAAQLKRWTSRKQREAYDRLSGFGAGRISTPSPGSPSSAAATTRRC